MPSKEYSVRKQAEAQNFLFDKLDVTPLSVPVGHVIPETQTAAIQRILLASGAITREQFESALGLTFDGEFSDEDELDIPFSVDEDFEQSRFASYVNDQELKSVEVPNVETKQVDKATAVQNEQSQVASSDSDNSGADNSGAEK